MAVKKCVGLLLLSYFSSIQCELNHSLLPNTYELDDPNDCSDNNGVFCKISIILTPYNGTDDSMAWQLIEESAKDYQLFQREKLFHGRCFKKNQMKSLNKILEEDYALKYKDYNLKGNVRNFSCFEKGRLILNDLDYWDLFFITLGTIYAFFMAAATAYTYFVDHRKDQIVAKVMSIFSFITIWRELRQPIKNEDFQNLKSIQGMRTLTMMLIISSHAFYGNMFTFLRNPEFVENIYSNLLTRGVILIFTFLVQTFFLVSAWLLTIQVEKIVKKNGSLTFKDIFLLGLNRYLRLIPVVIVVIIVLRSNLAYDLISYINEDVMLREVEICRNFWWKNLLFVQNIYEPDKICSAVTWYLATDYQLYIISLVIFYVSHKMQIDKSGMIAWVAVGSIAIQVTLINKTEFQGFLRLFPKTANLEDMLVSKAFTLSYIPIWCNAPTYMIGIVFGTLYSKRKNENLFDSMSKKAVWFLTFFGLPVFTIFISSFPYESRVFEALISISARPVFAVGIGIGILGMATKTGGLVKRILESGPLVFLGNFCFCVYLFHYAFVYLRILREDRMVDLSVTYIVEYTLIDYILSFTFGAVIYIVIEHPWIQLQKLVIPQVTTKKNNLEEPNTTPNKPISGNTF